MINISQSLGMPTIFIRYNPDKFKTDKKIYNPSFNERMLYLTDILNYTFKLKPNELPEFCSLRKLYFNGWKITDAKYYSILDFNK